MAEYLKPAHLALSVRDLDESIGWYRDHLGFELVFSMYLGQHQRRMAFIRHGSFDLELMQHDRSLPMPEERRDPHEDAITQGVKHVAFLVDDLEAQVARLAAEGVEIANAPRVMENLEHGVREKICFIRDPNGIPLELIERL